MKSKHDKHYRFTFKHAERNCYNCGRGGRGGPGILCNSPGLAVHCYMRHYKWWVPERKQAKRNDPSRVVMVKGQMVGCSAYVVPFQSSGYNHQRVVSLFHEAERLAAKAQEAHSG